MEHRQAIILKLELGDILFLRKDPELSWGAITEATVEDPSVGVLIYQDGPFSFDESTIAYYFDNASGTHADGYVFLDPMVKQFKTGGYVRIIKDNDVSAATQRHPKSKEILESLYKDKGNNWIAIGLNNFFKPVMIEHV